MLPPGRFQEVGQGCKIDGQGLGIAMLWPICPRKRRVRAGVRVRARERNAPPLIILLVYLISDCSTYTFFFMYSPCAIRWLFIRLYDDNLCLSTWCSTLEAAQATMQSSPPKRLQRYRKAYIMPFFLLGFFRSILSVYMCSVSPSSSYSFYCASSNYYVGHAPPFICSLSHPHLGFAFPAFFKHDNAPARLHQCGHHCCAGLLGKWDGKDEIRYFFVRYQIFIGRGLTLLDKWVEFCVWVSF